MNLLIEEAAVEVSQYILTMGMDGKEKGVNVNIYRQRK